MISVLTTIVYIISVVDETYNNKNTQKGVAISRTDTEDGYQIYKFIAYTASGNDLNTNNTSCEITQRLQQNKIYQISGKFMPLKGNSLNVIITTSIRLEIDEDNAPISKPIAHLIGTTLNNAEITNAGYALLTQ
ncbi:4765_t:CDS:1, partial [Paraglomus occultum]